MLFRKFLGKDTDSLTQAEEAVWGRLANSYRRLLVEGGRVNTKSEAGYSACSTFLEGLEAASRTLRLDPASRTYRLGFTINYRALFPDEARNYRVDVLEASVEQYAVIWVNGDKFEFSVEAMHRAEELQKAWADLGAILDRWLRTSEQPRATARPNRTELREALVLLDHAWAQFEHKYIAELIGIEEKARRLIVQAIEHEHCMQTLEAQYGNKITAEDIPEYREERRRLVACIGRLNSVANFRRKGRDDLGVDVLDDAVATLRRCDDAEFRGGSTELLSAARVLAWDAVDAFAAMREYLREVERCLERVDPHLCNNTGLVARLVDWEETWEVGSRYVQHTALLNAVCDLVAEIRSAQQLAPALSTMCEECDVELFLVLPRLLWLRFLSKPMQHVELINSLVPHRFAPKSTATPSGEGAPWRELHSWDSELEEFIEKFRRTEQLLAQAQPSSSGSDFARNVAWEMLVERIVNGTKSTCQDSYRGLEPAIRDAAQAQVEELMHELERWSIELQRHCPEDWNQCSAILVRCLVGGSEKQRHVAFRV